MHKMQNMPITQNTQNMQNMQNKQNLQKCVKPNLLKFNLPNQTYQIKPIKPNQIKQNQTKPSHPIKIYQKQVYTTNLHGFLCPDLDCKLSENKKIRQEMIKSEFLKGTSSRKNLCKTCRITIIQGGRSWQPFFRRGQKLP